MPTTAKKVKQRAPRNRTIELNPGEIERLRASLVFAENSVGSIETRNAVICGDTFYILDRLPSARFDLLFADPPYNLTKDFGAEKFNRRSSDAYEAWLDSWLKLCVRLLTPTASVYVCGDWRSSAAIQRVGSRYFKLQNRITWEREKGRGAKANWKNSSEDIYFCTASKDYTFNLDAVKVARRVIAPYTDSQGAPKDWVRTATGGERLTHPSNLWNIVLPANQCASELSSDAANDASLRANRPA